MLASSTSLYLRIRCQGLVRFFACFELNHILHRLCGPPSIPLSFTLACILPRRRSHCVCFGTEISLPTPAPHRLRRGLLGYLILFAPHAFVPQRQVQARRPPSPLVFFHISTHFTATHGVPPPSPVLKPCSFQSLNRLSRSLLLQTCTAACAPFTPNHSG